MPTLLGSDVAQSYPRGSDLKPISKTPDRRSQTVVPSLALLCTPPSAEPHSPLAVTAKTAL